MVKKIMNQNMKLTFKIAGTVIGVIVGVLIVFYFGMLTVLGAWSHFGERFEIEGGRVYFLPSCECDGEDEYLHCSVTADPYSWCECEQKIYHNGESIHRIDKPIIYLYPETETDVEVKLSNPERLTVTYPKYEDGWNVKAWPNGDLIDKKSGNRLYALYWEGEADYGDIDTDEGFVIEGEGVARFLEEKLEILGLNYKEKEEFITYWLPKMEKNKYNYVKFLTADEIEEDMAIEVSVEPETTIRVRMIFSGMEEWRDVKEQKLENAPGRNGFTLVEWGGSEI